MSRRRSRATWQRNQRDREEPGCSHRSLRNQKGTASVTVSFPFTTCAHQQHTATPPPSPWSPKFHRRTRADTGGLGWRSPPREPDSA
uniref:Uncharacterized protein n=1 Tax=Mustela putorius furo TaxID=9669 RepID=M3YS76_MUSPF